MVFFNQKVECKTIFEKMLESPELKFLVDKDRICEVRNAAHDEKMIPRDEQ